MSNPVKWTPKPGGSGSTNNQSGRSKVDIQAIASITTRGNHTFDLHVKVRVISNGQVLVGQVVVLESSQEFLLLDSKPTDLTGYALLTHSGTLLDYEQRLKFRVVLEGNGMNQEKLLDVRIPAKVPPTKKDLQIRIARQYVNQANNTLDIRFECIATDDGKIMVLEDINVAADTHNLMLSRQTDNNGVAEFPFSIPMGHSEQSVTFSFRIVQFAHKETATVIVPAIAAKKVKDPAKISLWGHVDRSCNPGRVRIKVRVTEENGWGVAGKNVTIFVDGHDVRRQTDSEGEVIIPLRRRLDPGEKIKVRASVSGIPRSAHIHPRRHRDRSNQPKPFERGWFFRVNNGRAFLLACVTILIWLSAILIGPGKPLLNPSAFRGKPIAVNEMTNKVGAVHHEKVRLSKSERFYNEAAAIVGEEYMIKGGEKPYSGSIRLWQLGVLLTIVSILYIIIASREEVAEAIEESVETLIDKSSDEASDPVLERLAKWYGLYSEVVRKPVEPRVVSAGQPDITALMSSSHPDNLGGHPSLDTILKIDLMANGIMEVVKAVFGKIWGRG